MSQSAVDAAAVAGAGVFATKASQSPRSTTTSPVADSVAATRGAGDANNNPSPGPGSTASSSTTSPAGALALSAVRDHNHAPMRKLSVHLLETYRHINQVYYAEKQARANTWDDKQDNYIIKAGEVFNERFTFRKQVGKGSFGVVAHATDGEYKREVAIKIIKSQRPFAKQAQTEIKLLEFMRDKNRDDAHGIVRLLEHLRHRSHVCLVFEFLGMNLYELIKKTTFRGAFAFACALMPRLEVRRRRWRWLQRRRRRPQRRRRRWW
jgi:hypothetical protein